MREDVEWGYRIIDILKQRRQQRYIPGYQSTGEVCVYPDERIVVVKTILTSYEKVCYYRIIEPLKEIAEEVLQEYFPGWTHQIEIR